MHLIAFDGAREAVLMLMRRFEALHVDEHRQRNSTQAVSNSELARC
jgi:hypothetical protein